jgi:hypothetical protein
MSCIHWRLNVRDIVLQGVDAALPQYRLDGGKP